MTDTTNAATKRHKLTTAGIVTAGIGVLLGIIGIIGLGSESPIIFLGGALAFLLIPIGIVLMIAGWMIRMRQAAESR